MSEGKKKDFQDTNNESDRQGKTSKGESWLHASNLSVPVFSQPDFLSIIVENPISIYKYSCIFKLSLVLHNCVHSKDNQPK